MDDGWVVESFEYTVSPIGLVAGTARITNTADIPRGALYTFTLLDEETIVTSFTGSSNEVPSGDTATVTLLGGDTYVEGEFSYAFQVDYSFPP